MFFLLILIAVSHAGLVVTYPAHLASRATESRQETQCCLFVEGDSTLKPRPQELYVQHSEYDQIVKSAVDEINKHVFFVSNITSGTGGIVRDNYNTLSYGEIPQYPFALAVTYLWTQVEDSHVYVVEWDQIFNTRQYDFDLSHDNSYDLKYTMLHEFVHVLGCADLSHNSICATSVMWFSVGTGPQRSILDNTTIACLLSHGYAGVEEKGGGQGGGVEQYQS